MQADLICVGNEILTGLVENSNAGYLSRRLWSAGLNVRETCVTADTEEAIKHALERGLRESEIVILTGGLGPTDDDLTREAVASILGKPLVLNEKWLEKMERFFLQRGFVMSDNNRKQAYYIEGGIFLENRRGTAPGVIVESGDRMIVMLPGPPHEMELMFEETVLPMIKARNKDVLAVVKTLKCIGIGESMLEEKVKSLGRSELANISYVARGYEVCLQIKSGGKGTGVGDGIEQAEELLRKLLRDYIYGSDDDTLAGKVAELLLAGPKTLALAESCSGGTLSDLITDIPGSSQFYRGGVVAYSRQAKESILGLDRALLDNEGEVSEKTAKAMAVAARRVFGADFGASITGIAGPQSDASDRPVGLVYVAVAHSTGTRCLELTFGGGRKAIKERAAQMALNMLRQELLGLPSGKR